MLYALITGCIGLAWGVGVLLFMQQIDFSYQVFAMFMNGCMVAGAVAAYAPSVQACNAFILINSGGRLLSLINDILDFSKIEAGRSSWRAVHSSRAPL